MTRWKLACGVESRVEFFQSLPQYNYYRKLIARPGSSGFQITICRSTIDRLDGYSLSLFMFIRSEHLYSAS